MKKIIILLILVFGIVFNQKSFAQSGKVNGKNGKKHEHKEKKHHDDDDDDKKSGLKIDAKVKINFGEEDDDDDHKKKKHDHDDDNDDNDDHHKKDKGDHPGKGHAYGKNKGDLSGREFGQERARQAREKHKEKEEELNVTLSDAEIKIRETKIKIEALNRELEIELKDGKISKVEYESEHVKIKKVEEAVFDLEAKVKIGNVLLEVDIQK